MDNIFGNLVEDAQIMTSSKNKQFIAFRVAVDSRRYSSATGKRETFTRFYNCYYWISTAIAKSLTTGRTVYLEGDKDASAWIDKKQNPRVNYLFNATEIRLGGAPKGKQSTTTGAQENPQDEKNAMGAAAARSAEPEPVHETEVDDLPF